MGCGSSRVAVSTVSMTQNGSTKKIMENGNVINENNKLSATLQNMESYSSTSKPSSPCTGNFRRKKQNLIPSTEIFKEVDEKSIEIPSTCSSTPKALVDYLTAPYNTDLMRLRALWIWVTHNISYDVHGLFDPNELKNSKADASNVLTYRKAVCSGYANLLKELVEIIGIKMEKVCGWSKGYCYVPGMKFNGNPPNHSWNAVLLNGSWWLMDPTWGAGYVDANKNFVCEYSEHYFLADPNQFIYDHLPKTQSWQLLEHPISMETYEGYLKLTKHFFRLNIKPVSHMYGIIDCDTGKLHMKFRLDKDIPVKCTGKLCEEGSTVGTDKYIHIYSTEKTLHVLVDIPREGKFRLKLFAERLKDDSDSQLSVICSYLVICTEKLGNASEFPKQFRKWSPGFYLHSPTDGVLHVGDTYKFRITLPGITDMAVCLGGKISKWDHLVNTNDALWEGELTLSSGTERINIVARRKENSPFSSLLEYKVVEKD